MIDLAGLHTIANIASAIFPTHSTLCFLALKASGIIYNSLRDRTDIKSASHKIELTAAVHYEIDFLFITTTEAAGIPDKFLLLRIVSEDIRLFHYV